METCKFNDFLKLLDPWLDRDYIRKVYVTQHDQLVFYFSDGGQTEYRIDDCSRAQLKEILDGIQSRGIVVEMAQ